MRALDIQAINERVQQESVLVDRILQEMDRVIVGQRYMVERLLIGLLCGGHVLLEGVPGLAKTLTVRTLARTDDVKAFVNHASSASAGRDRIVVPPCQPASPWES